MGFLLIWALLSEAEDLIELIRGQHLDLNERLTVGKAFESYPFFERFEWDVVTESDVAVVVFRGYMEDQSAVAHFREKYRYAWRTNIKAMQLEPTYGLDKHKDMLSFSIHFEVDEGNGFSVTSGFLGIRHNQTREWRQVRLSNKALVKVINGFYLERNPYLSLIEGLPFQ